MRNATAQKEAVRAATERLGEATSEELSAYIEEAFGLTIHPYIVAVLIGTRKEREHLDRVSLAAREKMERWKAENPEEAKKLAATAKRKVAARRKKAEANAAGGAAIAVPEVSPALAPDIMAAEVAESPAGAEAAKASAALPTLG